MSITAGVVYFVFYYEVIFLKIKTMVQKLSRKKVLELIIAWRIPYVVRYKLQQQTHGSLKKQEITVKKMTLFKQNKNSKADGGTEETKAKSV